MTSPITLPQPPDETETAIVRLVVREYPRGGLEHERAIRMALRLGWTAAIAGMAAVKEISCG